MDQSSDADGPGTFANHVNMDSRLVDDSLQDWEIIDYVREDAEETTLQRVTAEITDSIGEVSLHTQVNDHNLCSTFNSDEFAHSVDPAISSHFREDYDYDYDYESDDEIYTEYHCCDDSNNPVYIPMLNATGKSYRDVVLSRPKYQGSVEQQLRDETNLRGNSNPNWKPVINVAKVSRFRIDRQYVHQKNNVAYEDDEDDDGFWDLVYAELDTKTSTAASFSRSKRLLLRLKRR